MVQGGTKIPMGVTITLIVGLKNFYSIILMFKIFNMFFPNSGMLYSAQKKSRIYLTGNLPNDTELFKFDCTNQFF